MEEAFKINKKSTKRRNDTSVQGTNDSSILSKISTCQSGYFTDDYLKYFATKIVKRSSLVNRGYYIRAKLLDFLIKEFIEKSLLNSNHNQIINLGAGFDASYFRLKQQNLLGKTLFIEIDFPDVVHRKFNLIKSNENLLSLCPGLVKLKEVNENIVYGCESSNYILIGIDMRNTGLLEVFLKTINGFSETENTFLLSEVVLTYMAVNSCNGVIKWISEVFQNCVLAIYEQMNPFDGFGQVMLEHFKKLGSPLKCILKYPSLNSHIERYKHYSFTDCFAMRASDFYCHHTLNEEKLRIDKLELFDEYEPWHQKCSHYLIISATKGDYLTNVMSNLYSTIPIPQSIENVSLETNEFDSLIQYKPFDFKFGTRFGHSVCYSNRNLFVFGGFGEMAADLTGKHMRHCSVEVLNLDTMSVRCLNQVIDPNNPICDRIFHSSLVLESNDSKITILVIYGRSNPSKIYNSIVKVQYSIETEQILSMESVNIDVVKNYSRFRHGSCLTSDSKLFIYGGKIAEENTCVNRVLNDALIFDNQFNIVHKIDFDESICVGRHSHSLAMWKNYIVISGGLDQYENPLNDVILFDCDTLEIRRIVLKNGKILPRYSHTSHIIEDFLILVGGVNYLDIPPGVCFLDLNRLTAHEFNIQFQTNNSEPFMLNNHQSYLIDKNALLVIGGGGICFTFGTHLNRQNTILGLAECWTQIMN